MGKYEDNIQLAKDTLRYCKNYISKSGTSPYIQSDFWQTIKQVMHESRSRTMSLAELAYQSMVFERDTKWFHIKEEVKATKEFQVGNCGEYTSLAFNYLRKRDVYYAEIVSIIDSDHVFVILDRDPESDINEPSKWGDSCVVIDLLLNNIFKPKDIYVKLQCYDGSKEDPQKRFTPFTRDHKLEVNQTIAKSVDLRENLAVLAKYKEKIVTIKKIIVNYLSVEEYYQFEKYLNKIHFPDVTELAKISNLQLERFLEKTSKNIIKEIEKIKTLKKEEMTKLLGHLIAGFGTFIPDLDVLYRKLLDIDFETFQTITPYLLILRDTDGDTILHSAAREGKLDIISYLLTLGVNWNNPNNRNETPQHLYLQYLKNNFPSNDDHEIKKFIHQLEFAKPSFQQELDFLNAACYFGNQKLIYYFVEKMKNNCLNTEDSKNCFSLIYAINTPGITTLQTLLKLGADINKETSKGLTPLSTAIDLKDIEKVIFLLYRGAKISQDCLELAKIKDADIYQCLLSNSSNQVHNSSNKKKRQ